jgi:GxxExxY protein
MEFEEITGVIIGCAYKVYNAIGYGFLESVYQKCLLIELKKAGLSAVEQYPIIVVYEGEIVGNFVADLLVNDAIIIELKSVMQLAKAHEVQLVNYLAATGKTVGLLINFGEKSVQVKRKWRTRNRSENTNEEMTFKYPVDPVNPV